MKQIAIGDLKPLQTSAHLVPRPRLRKLSDQQLLDAVSRPRHGDHLVVNTKTGLLHDGNGRAHELLRRAADPNSQIKPEIMVPVEEYTPDLSMFRDLD